jgi:predicted nuclease of restriction endonuclease-like (RecB) superfamily
MKYTQLLKAIDATSQHLVGRAAAAVNQALVIRNWLIGAYIVEFEQHGEDRARYGQRLYARLAIDLHARGAQGCGERMLQQMAHFYRAYPQFGSGIPQPVVAELQKLVPIIFGKPLTAAGDVKKSSPAVRKSTGSPIPQPLVTEFTPPLPSKLVGDSVTTGDRISSGKKSRPARSNSSAALVASPDLILRFSWSQLLELIRIDDQLKRAFYENECLKGNWSKRQLQRQIGSLLFERTGLSKNKAAVIRRAYRQESPAQVADLIRDPYVLEFAGLTERAEYAESDLERALLDHLQQFLLELGTGFCFEARQKRITVGNEHDYIDLVFYHRRLRCHVLVELKTRPFTHGDAGQMNFYLNWWKTHGMEKGDQLPVGILLCTDRDRTKVEFATAGMDNKLFVSRYLVALPSPKQLQEFIERDRDQIEAQMTKGSAS